MSRIVGAIASACVLISLAVGPVGAYWNVTQTGMVGHWSINDTTDSPGATCKYGREYAPDYAGFRWMSVQPPVVFAADRNSNKVDQETVEWSWKLQRGRHYNTNTWTTIATSAVQTATAYDNQAASLSVLRITHNVGNPDINGVVYRAKVVIKWVKPDGSVEGKITATIDYYWDKNPGTDALGGASYCWKVITAG